MTEEKIVAMTSSRLDALTMREQLAIAYVDRASLDYESIDEAFFGEMRSAFSEAEIVWLAMFVWWCSGRHKFFHIFDVPPPEVDSNGTWTMTVGAAVSRPAMTESSERWAGSFLGATTEVREALCAPSTVEYSARDAACRRLAEFYGCTAIAIEPVDEAVRRIAALGTEDRQPSERARTASEFADRFALSHRMIDGTFLEEARGVFTEAEIVELTALLHWCEGAYKATVIFRAAQPK